MENRFDFPLELLTKKIERRKVYTSTLWNLKKNINLKT
ncbi:hypothetical protein MSHv_02960 [Mycoplasmopsis synoviae]|nr:hypothetical protein MSHv_02960 [Mycoplasmopsis synoviae]AQU48093.1 hypothetical protein ADF19_02960 [Mycoplasmopsis synoviae]